MSFLFYCQFYASPATIILLATIIAKDLILFVTLAFFVYASYAMGFWALHYIPDHLRNDTMNHFGNNTQSCEPVMFQTLLHSIYEVMLLSVAVVEPTSIYYPRSTNMYQAMIMYLGFTVACILLLNLLIAIFSERVAHIQQHETSVSQLHELSMMLAVHRYIHVNQLIYEPCKFFRRCVQKVRDNESVLTLDVMEEIERKETSHKSSPSTKPMGLQ